MNTLRLHLEKYLQLRRRLGFTLRLAGGHLRKFVRFAQRQRTSVSPPQLAPAVGYPTGPIASRRSGPSSGHGTPLRQYLSAVDPRT